MNAAQVQAVQQVLSLRLPQLTRYQVLALAFELAEAVDNKAVPMPRGTTAPNVEG